MAEYGTFTMAGAPVTEPANFTMYDPPRGDPDDPVPYTKKDRTRNLPKPEAKVREFYSTRRIQVANRLIYYKDP